MFAILFIDAKVIDGTGPDGLPSSLSVILNEMPIHPEFTYPVEYALDKSEAMVKTMAPINLFDYEADGAAISIRGHLTVKLAGAVRHLRIVSPDRTLQANSAVGGPNAGEADFKLSVKLEQVKASESDLKADGTKMNHVIAAIGIIMAQAAYMLE